MVYYNTDLQQLDMMWIKFWIKRQLKKKY